MSEAHATGPAGLLATKLFAPLPLDGFVARPRLLDGLNGALARGLIVVCAPAGSGKSALLAHWAWTGQRQVAWLSLDDGDNDPARFWRHIAVAIDQLCPGIGERVTSLLGPPTPATFEGLAVALINELATQPEHSEVVLILDDYHVIDSNLVHASLTYLIEHRPPNLHIVLTSRADPPLPLARIRVRGQLVELRAAELRFTTSEAAALLSAATGAELPDSAVTALVARTEGWAAGLQLAGLSLQPARGAPGQGHNRSDMERFVTTFSGSNRYVLDYLTEEVLERQPPLLREFLLDTSILERLSGPLCDALTGRTDGQATLEEVERANLFLVPLDEVRGWWRYHHLFADLLRARSHRREPDRIGQLHRGAAVWLDRHGMADDALRHALAAGDTVWGARLVEQHADALLLHSEGITLERWLAALPARLVDSRPRLLLAQVNLALLSGDVEVFEVPLNAAERALARTPALLDEPYEPSVGRQASLLANVPAAIALGRSHLAELRGDAERTSTYAAQAQALLGEDEWMLGALIRAHIAVAELLRGRLPAAERGFAESIARYRAAGERFVAVRACELLGQIQRAGGRLDSAIETYQQVLEIATPPGQAALPAAGRAYVAMAEVEYQRDELDQAHHHVTDGIALCRQLVHAMRGAPQPLATGLAVLAWIRQAEGDVRGAREAMAEAEDVAPGPDVTSLLNPVHAQGAQLCVAHGDLGAAVRWTEERGLSADDEPVFAREPEYFALARVLLAQDLPTRALILLERLRANASAQRRVSSLIEVEVLRALAFEASHQESSALSVLDEALTLAAPQGFIRIFVDAGAPMRALLGRLVALHRRERTTITGVSLDYFARLSRAFDRESTHGSAHNRTARMVVPGLIEPLSERELEVVRLLAQGRRNREIGEELSITLDTVNKHVTHILEKLGTGNRTEAIARARELGLFA